MKRSTITLTLVAAAFTLTGCGVIDAVTGPSNTGYWHSDCHPEIYTTAVPRDTVPQCAWHWVHTK